MKKAVEEQAPAVSNRQPVPDYSKTPNGPVEHILAFLVGFAAGAVVLYIFYRIPVISALGGLVVGAANIYASSKSAIKKRLLKLRVQFFDLLEALSVAMRAGNPVLTALMSAKNDLGMIYSPETDIMVELDIIIRKFNNAIPLSAAFQDMADRSGLEDIDSFASIYATIEGKSSRANEIVRETQQIIADKMEIEMEIDAMMTAAKSEANIMLFMPLVILAVIGTAGAGFMDAIYTTPMGRAVATGGLIVFIISFVLTKIFSNVKI